MYMDISGKHNIYCKKVEMIFKTLIRVGRAIFYARWPAHPFTRDLAVGLFWSSI